MKVNNKNLNVSCVIDKQSKDVFESIKDLCTYYHCFVVKKNGGINELMHTFNFTRQKGMKIYSFQISVIDMENGKTKLDFICTSDSQVSTSQDLQKAITEVQNIIAAKINGVEPSELNRIIKNNDSGNGIMGFLEVAGALIKSITILFFLGIIIFMIIKCSF